MTRAQILLFGLLLLALGAAGQSIFQASGFEGFSAGIAASVVLLLVVLGWTATYLVRVVSGRMTFSEQRRRYRSAYDEATDQLLQERFASLPPEEQARLMADLGLASDAEQPSASPDRVSPGETSGSATP